MVVGTCKSSSWTNEKFTIVSFWVGIFPNEMRYLSGKSNHSTHRQLNLALISIFLQDPQPNKLQFGHDTSLQYHLHSVHDELKLLGICFLLPSHTTFALHASAGPPSRAGLNDGGLDAGSPSPHLSMTLASKNRPSISAVSPVTTIPAWMGKRKYVSFIFDSLTDGSPQIHWSWKKKTSPDST